MPFTPFIYSNIGITLWIKRGSSAGTRNTNSNSSYKFYQCDIHNISLLCRVIETA